MILFPGLIAKSGLAPRSKRTGVSDRALSFSATMRVIYGIHYDAANMRALTHVAFTSGFADLDVRAVLIADLADSSHTVKRNVTEFAAGQPHKSFAALFCHQLSHVSGAAYKLSALAGIKLNVVDNGTDRNIRDRKGVSGKDVRIRTVLDLVAHLQSGRSKDVAFLTIFILKKSNESGAVGIVFNALHSSSDIKLVPLEIDHTVFLTVSAAVMTDGDATLSVSAGMLLQRLEKTLFRRY